MCENKKVDMREQCPFAVYKEDGSIMCDPLGERCTACVMGNKKISDDDSMFYKAFKAREKQVEEEKEKERLNGVK